jgi:DNA primase
VLQAARPLVDMLWTREVEAGPLDTPERRAAFERRLKEPLGQIKDEATRRHYRREMDERLAQLFASAAPARAERGRDGGFQRGTPQGGGGGRNGWQAVALGRAAQGVSQLTQSRMMAGRRGEDVREAFILLALASHPDLILRCADEIAELRSTVPPPSVFAKFLLDAAMDDSLDENALSERLAQPRVQEAQGALMAVTGPAERLKLAQAADPESVFDSIRQAIVPTERTDDPVRMYLREMGTVELLSREGEIAIAKRIEAGREAMIAGLCESPLTFQAIIIWRDELNEGKICCATSSISKRPMPAPTPRTT